MLFRSNDTATTEIYTCLDTLSLHDALPITKPADLAVALEKAIAEVDAGNVAVIDVRVEPGYTAVMTQAMTRAGN